MKYGRADHSTEQDACPAATYNHSLFLLVARIFAEQNSIRDFYFPVAWVMDKLPSTFIPFWNVNAIETLSWNTVCYDMAVPVSRKTCNMEFSGTNNMVNINVTCQQ